MTRIMIGALAERFDFDVEEAIRFLLEDEEIIPKPKKKVPVRPKTQHPQPKKIPLPWLGIVQEEKCHALNLNYGLYTQCLRDPIFGGKYCDKCCHKQEHVTIEDRKDPGFNGKGKKSVVLYGLVLKNRNITREEAEEYAKSIGIAIPNHEFEIDKRKYKKQKLTHDPNVEL